MTKQIQTVDETFLDFFRKKKGVYSQEDVEKIVAQAKQEAVEKELRDILHNLPQEQEKNPLLGKDKEMWGYGQYHFRNRVLAYLKSKIKALQKEQE